MTVPVTDKAPAPHQATRSDQATEATEATGASGDPALRDQLAGLHGLLTLSMLMTGRGSEDDVLRVATTAVPALGHCRIEGVYLLGLGWRATAGACTRPGVRADVQARLARLRSSGGELTIVGAGWAWAFALRGFDGHAGYLVVVGDHEPATAELFLLRVLAQQAGIALANSRLHLGQRAAIAELRSTNAALADTVRALQRRAAVHDRLTQVAVAGEGRQGIAQALYELTGLPAVVEDQHGNQLARAGPVAPPVATGIPPARRERLLGRAVRAGRPIRADGRLLAVAHPRDDVLGVLALLDPDGRAGEPETVALEHAAAVLAMELTRLRSLADTELRLGHDLVEELIEGTAGDGAQARARTAGYDLQSPHRVLVVDGPGCAPEALLRAVGHAARGSRVGPLLLPRAGTVVGLAGGDGEDWGRFRAAVLDELGTGGRCRVGVGGSCRSPADLPRSYREARLALRLHPETGPDRAVAYEDLGVYQLLSEVDTEGVERFVRRWLGSLLDYDERRGTELVATVSHHLECGGNYDATARALGVGRSTVKYRLQRIRQISGHDLAHPDTRFNLHLATRAWRTLRSI